MKITLRSIFITLIAIFSVASLFAGQIPSQNSQYPIGPDNSITPGSLCKRPTSYRYSQRIAYCERNVDSQLKKEIFQVYRAKLKYVLDPNDRSNYKIDHLIPLCAGGSNEQNNLWPQHKSIYEITDPIEQIACEQLKAGRIDQEAAIKAILEVKHQLRLAADTIRYLQSL